MSTLSTPVLWMHTTPHHWHLLSGVGRAEGISSRTGQVVAAGALIGRVGAVAYLQRLQKETWSQPSHSKASSAQELAANSAASLSDRPQTDSRRSTPGCA